MTTLINKESTQHYANKMVLAENRKVGSKSLPAVLNEIDALIDEMKTHFDAEYGSALDMKLENNENVFSIGTGTNIDKKDDVENSFTDVELSGNTVINLIQEKSYLDWHVLYCGRKSAEGVFIGRGQKYASQAAPNNTTSTDVRCNIISKKNSVYTLIFDAKVIEGTSSEFTIVYNGICIRNTAKIKDGRNVILIRSDDSQNGTFQIYEVTGNNNESDINIRLTNIVILEGDWTNRPIPQYFEGLKSVGEKEDGNHKISISSVSKNLFEPTVSQKSSSITANTQYSIENNGYSISISSSVNRPTTETASHIHFGEVKLKIGETYVVSADKMIKDTNTATPQIRIAYWDKQNNRYATIGYLTNHTSVFTFTVESGKEYVALGLYSHGALLTNGQTVKATYEGVRLYLKSTSNTSYEPHKSDKKEISLNEPLRGLPNGIRDTIEKINGEWKIVRRCGIRTVNGSEKWAGNITEQTTDIVSSYFMDEQSLPYSALLSDKQASLTKNEWNNCSVEGIFKGDGGIGIAIKKSRLSEVSITALKQWIKSNPFEVIFELATPIIEDISPVTLQC